MIVMLYQHRIINNLVITTVAARRKVTLAPREQQCGSLCFSDVKGQAAARVPWEEDKAQGRAGHPLHPWVPSDCLHPPPLEDPRGETTGRGLGQAGVCKCGGPESPACASCVWQCRHSQQGPLGETNWGSGSHYRALAHLGASGGSLFLVPGCGEL